jgi:hypothetical protein
MAEFWYTVVRGSAILLLIPSQSIYGINLSTSAIPDAGLHTFHSLSSFHSTFGKMA